MDTVYKAANAVKVCKWRVPLEIFDVDPKTISDLTDSYLYVNFQNFN